MSINSLVAQSDMKILHRRRPRESEDLKARFEDRRFREDDDKDEARV